MIEIRELKQAQMHPGLLESFRHIQRITYPFKQIPPDALPFPFIVYEEHGQVRILRSVCRALQGSVQGGEAHQSAFGSESAYHSASAVRLFQYGMYGCQVYHRKLR